LSPECFFLRILDLNGIHLLLLHSLPHSHAVRDNDLGSRSQGQPQSPDFQRRMLRSRTDQSIKMTRLFLKISLLLFTLIGHIHGLDVDSSFLDDENNATEASNVTDIATIAPTESLVPYTKPDCYNNLTILGKHMKDKPYFVRDTFILCPNTYFDLGGRLVYDHPLSDTWVIRENGQAQLMGKNNAIVKCGEDGKSSNNCVLRGGSFQFVAVWGNFQEETEEMEVHGVTFSGGTSSVIYISEVKHVILRDCIIRVRCTVPLSERLSNTPLTGYKKQMGTSRYVISWRATEDRIG